MARRFLLMFLLSVLNVAAQDWTIYGGDAPSTRFSPLKQIIDAHVIALDKRTGQVLWDILMADYLKGYSATAAPLLVKDKIIVGIAGGDYGNRGFIDAYSVTSGERLWRFWTIPAPGEPDSE